MEFIKPTKVLLAIIIGAIALGCGVAMAADNEDWANLRAYSQKNSELLLQGPMPHRVVFMGDSITEFWDKTKSDLFSDTHYVNRGISGQTTPQMLLRFRQDVIALRPEAVVILAGTNDIAGNNGPVTNEQIQNNIMSMVDLARANNIKPILCSIVPAASYYWAPDLRPAPRIKAINTWMQAYARAQRIEYIDFYSPMETDGGALNAMYTGDGVHPNAEGYLIMTDLVKAKLSNLYRKQPR
jgi:lysophospholipase L1-like esterase